MPSHCRLGWNSESFPENAGAGDTTTWIYDPASGLLTEKHDNADVGPVYTYTVDGKLLTRKWARTDVSGNDLVTTYSYNAATGELTGVDYSDSTPDVTFTYDRLGRQSQITDAAGTRVFSYNADFSLASEAITGIYTKVLSRSYDSAPGVKGRYAGIEVGDGSPASGNVYQVNYGYDAKGRMNNVSWNVNNVPGSTTYSYLPSSDLLSGMSTARTDAPGYTPITADYVYEPHRDVKTQVLNRAGARTISQYDYRYNAIGNRTAVVNTGEAFGSQYPASSPENREGFNLYSYNSRSEVTESKRYSGTEVDNPPVDMVKPEYRSYAYDPIGNRTAAVEGNETQQVGKTTSYDSNGLNQYNTTTVTPTSAESATFTYDADGNMTSIADSTGYTLYVFDGENRLIEVRPETPVAGQKKVAFAYDFMGRRIKKDVYSWDNNAWSPASSRTFTWDGWLMTDETVTSAAPNSQPSTTSYVWGLDLSQTIDGAAGVGGLISMIRGNVVSPEQYLYCADGNGNISALVSDSGAISAAYEYDAFGARLRAIGPMSSINTIGFSTKPIDVESNLLIFPYRAYNVAIGKFITSDPAESAGGLNVYIYVTNTPVNAVDPLGLWKQIEGSIHLWSAEKGDTLEKLAVEKYGASSEDSQCLWPIMDTKDHGYPNYVKSCDKYDASNLSIPSPTATVLEIIADINLAAGSYRSIFPLAKIVPGVQIAHEIQQTSNEGRTPISWLILAGHGGVGGEVSFNYAGPGEITSRGSYISYFSVLSLKALDHGPSFPRAKQFKGPLRCWFARNARGRLSGCSSKNDAYLLANLAFRKGTEVLGTTVTIGTKMINNEPWIYWNPVYDKNGKVNKYLNNSNYYNASIWEKYNGSL